MLECIEETWLLMIGDDENTLDERREFDNGSDIVINLAIIEITFAGYSFKMRANGIGSELFSGSHMRRILPIDPSDYIIDFHYSTHKKLRFYDGNISVWLTLQKERRRKLFNFDRAGKGTGSVSYEEPFPSRDKSSKVSEIIEN